MTDAPEPKFEKPIIRRVHVAIFISGIFASVSVSLSAMPWALLFGATFENGLFSAPLNSGTGESFISAVGLTVIFSGLNFYLFFIVIPVAWMVIGIFAVKLKVEKTEFSSQKHLLLGSIATTLAIFLSSL